jgi:protein gp37
MTKIEWCDRTINPITGCLRGCPFCYARQRAKRLAGMERAHPGSTGYPTGGDPFRPTFHPNRIDQILKLRGKGKRIFLDSMGDWFSDGVQPEWLSTAVSAVRQKPEHEFLVLTKWTENLGMLKETPPNLWIGTSVTCQNDIHRIQELKGALSEVHKFISFEPIHGPIDVDLTGIDWIIIGAETGNRKGKIKPRPEWVESIRKEAGGLGIPVFLKDNLRAFLRAGCSHPKHYPPLGVV